MAQWDITVSAGSNPADGSTGTAFESAGTPPSDFDGATINSVTLVGTPGITTAGTSNDDIEIRFQISTSSNVAVWGTLVSTQDASLCWAEFVPFSSGSSDPFNLGASPNPAPTTAVAADWARVRWSYIYGANGKSDDETVSWASFQIRVDYTPVAAPVISTPTQTSIGQTTATVGFSTDTTSGTGYYYISTSATPPSAADLKAGASPADASGNSTITASPHTFNASGLTLNTSYYTHFIQNAALGDSNILTSTQWTTAAAATESHTFTAQQAFDLQNFKSVSDAISYIISLDENQSVTLEEALSFIIQVAQEQDNNKTIPLSLNLQSALDFVFSNLLNGTKSITIGALFDQVFSAPKTTLETIAFNSNLNYSFSTSVAGSVNFDTVLAYQADNFKTTLAALNADIIVSEASIVSKLMSEIATFSFTLDFDGVYTETAIFDDPVYSLSNSQYIFVDLNNILMAASTVKAGSITFTTQQGQQHTVSLVGQAAHTLLVNLATLQSANKTTTVARTLDVILDQNQVASFSRLATFSADLSLDYLTQSQADALRSILFQASLQQEQFNVKSALGALSVNAVLDQTELNTLLARASVSFDTTLDFLRTAAKDTSVAITILNQLLLNIDATIAIVDSINFDINLIQTQQVRGILSSTLNLIANLDQTSAKQLAAQRAIQFLIQLQAQFTTDGEVLGAVEFIAQMSQVSTNNMNAATALQLIVQLAETKNVSLDFAETLTLAITLADSYTNNKVTPTSLSLNVNLDQTQSSLLDKLLAISIGISLDKISTGNINFATFMSFIAALDAAFAGDVTGALQGIMTFGVQLQQQDVAVGLFNKDLSFDAIFSETGIGSKLLLDSLNLDITLEDGRSFDLTRYGLVNFEAILNKLDQSQVDFKPSINFDLQMLDAPTSVKNTLANILIAIEQGMLQDTVSGIIAALSFGLQQDFQTQIRLVAEGTAELSVQLAESHALQFLGQAGITFGHLVGLTALSRADLARTISFGTISELSIQGFVLAFTITLPDNRKLKVYFEDRITLIYPEERLVVVYP